MRTKYRISLNMRTASGMETVGCFYLGNDRAFAENTFGLLQGSEQVSEQTLLCMELTNLIGEVPLPLTIRHCTLEQLACNTRILARELFKQRSLEPL